MKSLLTTTSLTLLALLVLASPCTSFAQGIDSGNGLDSSTIPSILPSTISVSPNLDPSQIEQTITSLIEAIQSGNWILAIGFLIMLVVFLVNKIGKKWIPNKALPWIALGFGVLSLILTSLGSGLPLKAAIIKGISQGLVACGTWSVLGKHLFKSKEPKDES